MIGGDHIRFALYVGRCLPRRRSDAVSLELRGQLIEQPLLLLLPTLHSLSGIGKQLHLRILFLLLNFRLLFRWRIRDFLIHFRIPSVQFFPALDNLPLLLACVQLANVF